MYSTEKTMGELGDKLPAELKEEMTGHLDKIKEIKDGEDAQAINDAVNAAMEAAQKIGQHMYQATEGEGFDPENPDATPDADQGEAKKEEATEAEFEEKASEEKKEKSNE